MKCLPLAQANASSRDAYSLEVAHWRGLSRSESLWEKASLNPPITAPSHASAGAAEIPVPSDRARGPIAKPKSRRPLFKALQELTSHPDL